MEKISEEKAIEILEVARKNAINIIEIANKAAALLVEKTRIETGKMVVDSIKVAFGQGEEEQKIVRLNRVPYICESINQIEKNINEIKENTKDLEIIRKLVYGASGIILTAVIIALIYLIIKK